MEFERLVAKHQDAVYRQMVKVCGNREDAEDVLQEALLRAYKALGQLSDPIAFRAWLARIGRNVCYRLRTKAALLPITELPSTHPDGRPLPEDEAILEDLVDRVHRAIDSMAPLHREIYWLRDVEGLSTDEVGRRLGISVAAVKSRLHRARSELRKTLNAEFS
ncbi:MAG: RNA polymerase sigma factor [Armatimonadetes bacterium]|nr:RNA polymerase sigma factor [Armatimonadota bacterium]